MSSKKTALVTGSSNGIGESIAKALAKLDYALIITGRDQSDIKRVADECLKLSPSKLKVSSMTPLRPQVESSN